MPRLGRLFWKFFLFFWLAQVVTSAGVGLAIWIEHRTGDRAEFDRGPPPGPRPDHPPGFGPPPGPPHGGPHPHRHHPLPLMPLIGGGLVSLAFAALLAWYFARPIRGLRGAFEAVAGGRLDTRIGAAMGGRRDELADLGQDFDRMAERLQGLIESQRRLLHDVSHELRSPLARLQAAADLMRQQPERAAELVARVERDADRMDRLVGELLTLARLDSGMTPAASELLDLRDLVSDIADDARFEAAAKACAVEARTNGPAVVRGNSELLYRAIENVVRNAVRHAPAGGHIAVAAHASATGVRVVVEDNGPGLPAGDLEAAFAPFFRGGGAIHGEGYGLGLAITRRVMETHGGRACAENRAEGGLRVILTLPAAGAPEQR